MLGEIIKNLRTKYSITQAELATYLGVTPKAVSFYELGQREPSNEMLVALAKKFNVTTDYLLGLRNSKNGYMPLTPAEESLIKKIRQLDDDDQEELEAIIDMKITKLRKKNIEKEGIA